MQADQAPQEPPKELKLSVLAGAPPSMQAEERRARRKSSLLPVEVNEETKRHFR